MIIHVAELGSGASSREKVDFVSREIGRSAKKRTAEILRNAEDGSVATLDFQGVGTIDYTCADEFLAKLITRLNAGEYGLKHIRLKNVTLSHQENIDVALERKKLSVMLVDSDDRWICLGSLKPYLRKTLELVMDRKNLSARELSSHLGIELNTSSTRLINLYRQRLVTRHERAFAEGGREYVYAGLLFSHPRREVQYALF